MRGHVIRSIWSTVPIHLAEVAGSGSSGLMWCLVGFDGLREADGGLGVGNRGGGVGQRWCALYRTPQGDLVPRGVI